MLTAIIIHIVMIHAQMVSPIAGTRRTPLATPVASNYRAWVLSKGKSVVLRPGTALVLNYK